MIDAQQWRQVPLDERLAFLAAHTDDTQLRETLEEVLRSLSDHVVIHLRVRVAELETECRRLERLTHAPTPY